MSEENQVAEQPIEEVVDYKSLYEKTKSDLEAVAAKKEELLKETKQAKAQRAEAEAHALQAAKEKAAKDGEFEKLWQTAEKDKSDLQKRIEEITNSNRREKVQIAALKIANELADGDNVELLSDFIGRNLDKVADENGALSADVLSAIKTDFANNQKFKALLRGSKATGGSATGNMQGVAVQQDLSKLSPVDRINMARNGNK